MLWRAGNQINQLNMNKYHFKIESEAQFEAAKAYFLALGLETHFGNYTYERLVNNNYLYFVIDFDKNAISGHQKISDYLQNSKLIAFNDLFSLSVPVKVTVKLNENYSAEVSATRIKVGCQVFSLDIIDKLIEARDKVTKS